MVRKHEKTIYLHLKAYTDNLTVSAGYEKEYLLSFIRTVFTAGLYHLLGKTNENREDHGDG